MEQLLKEEIKEDDYLAFKKESIKYTKRMIDSDEIRELIFLSFQRGFENQNTNHIKLYLDEDYIKLCKYLLDLDLHGFIESILKD